MGDGGWGGGVHRESQRRIHKYRIGRICTSTAHFKRLYLLLKFAGWYLFFLFYGVVFVLPILRGRIYTSHFTGSYVYFSFYGVIFVLLILRGRICSSHFKGSYLYCSFYAVVFVLLI